MQKLNLQAFDKGFEYGATLVHTLAEEREESEPVSMETES
jgi:hypothetical protein